MRRRGRSSSSSATYPSPARDRFASRSRPAACATATRWCKTGAYPGLVFPRVPGHGIAGRVDAVGPNVTAWKAGERVGVGWHGGHCLQCDACRKGLFINCENGARSRASRYDGGYAEYVIAPAEAVARIPEKLERDRCRAAPLRRRHDVQRAPEQRRPTGRHRRRPGNRRARPPRDPVRGAHGVARRRASSRGADKEELARELGAHEYVDTAKIAAAARTEKARRRRLRPRDGAERRSDGEHVGGIKSRGKLLIVAAPHEPLRRPGDGAPQRQDGRRLAERQRHRLGRDDGVQRAHRGASAHREFKLEQAEEAYTKVMANKMRFRACWCRRGDQLPVNV